MSVLDLSNQHATEAQLGYTCLLEMGDGADLAAATNWTDVGEITDLTPLDVSRDSVEVTNHRSPDFSLEFIPALRDNGSATFTLNAVPEHLADGTHPQGKLMGLLSAAGNTPWRVTFPHTVGGDVTTLSFMGSLTAFTLNVPVKDVISADATIQVSGETVWETT